MEERVWGTPASPGDRWWPHRSQDMRHEPDRGQQGGMETNRMKKFQMKVIQRFNDAFEEQLLLMFFPIV